MTSAVHWLKSKFLAFLHVKLVEMSINNLVAYVSKWCQKRFQYIEVVKKMYCMQVEEYNESMFYTQS